MTFLQNSTSTPQSRVKLAVIVAVLALALVWITYQLSGLFSGHGVAQPLDTPAWRTANELTKKLAEDLRFNDIGLAVITEKPPAFRAEGMVHGQRTFDDLKAFLAAQAPDATIEYDVIVAP